MVKFKKSALSFVKRINIIWDEILALKRDAEIFFEHLIDQEAAPDKLYYNAHVLKQIADWLQYVVATFGELAEKREKNDHTFCVQTELLRREIFGTGNDGDDEFISKSVGRLKTIWGEIYSLNMDAKRYYKNPVQGNAIDACYGEAQVLKRFARAFEELGEIVERFVWKIRYKAWRRADEINKQTENIGDEEYEEYEEDEGVCMHY